MTDEGNAEELKKFVGMIRTSIISGVGAILVIGTALEFLVKPAMAQTATSNEVRTVIETVSEHDDRIKAIEEKQIQLQLKAVEDIGKIKQSQIEIATNLNNQGKKIDHLQELIEEMLKQ